MSMCENLQWENSKHNLAIMLNLSSKLLQLQTQNAKRSSSFLQQEETGARNSGISQNQI